MKYLIRRTSSREEKPCEEASEETYIHVDERVVDDPEKLNEHAKGWYENGINHRIENGHIKRDFIRKGWFAEIDDILTFAKKYGELIIIPQSIRNEDIPEIEIYDDYRE